MRASTGHAIGGLLVSLIGTAIMLGGIASLHRGEPPIVCIIGIVLGLLLIGDGSRNLNQRYPVARFRERVARLGRPNGMGLHQVRRALGRERDFERTEDGANLTWRVGGVSLTLRFDRNKVCAGVVAYRGLRAG